MHGTRTRNIYLLIQYPFTRGKAYAVGNIFLKIVVQLLNLELNTAVVRVGILLVCISGSSRFSESASAVATTGTAVLSMASGYSNLDLLVLVPVVT